MIKTLFYLLSLVVIVVGVMWFVNSGWLDAISFETTSSAAETVKNVVVGEEEKVEKDAWRFAFISDIEGVTNVATPMVKDMAARDIDFIVYGGDIVQRAETEGIKEIQALLESVGVPVHYAIGNNDLIYDETTERKTRALFAEAVDERFFYSFDHKGGHFVILDNSYMRDGFPQNELDWLAEDLAENEEEDEPTFLFFHRPLNVPGESFFGDDETPDSRVQNEKFREVISRYKINRIFNGHLHMYMSYTLDETPVTVSGGGGAQPQALLGGADAAFFHYLIVNVYEDGSHDVSVVEF